MRGRWLTGWMLTGVLITPVMNHAMNAEVYGLGRALALLLFIVGGALSVVVGARVSARLRGRNPRADAAMAGGAYLLSAVLFLALMYFRTAESEPDFPQFAVYAIVCLKAFGLVFGFAASIYYKARRRVVTALGCAGASVLAGLLMFVFSYLLAGGNLLVMYGIVSMKWKVPVGLVLSGLLGTLLPGMMVERLLGTARAPARPG